MRPKLATASFLEKKHLSDDNDGLKDPLDLERGGSDSPGDDETQNIRPETNPQNRGSVTSGTQANIFSTHLSHGPQHYHPKAHSLNPLLLLPRFQLTICQY